VTRYLLDTNIVSEAAKARPSPAIAEWAAGQADGNLFIATMTIAEIWRGILQRAPGRGRRDLETWFVGPHGPPAQFAGRILSFDSAAALEWARLMAEGSAVGRPRSAVDMIIAATAAANCCTVVTANDRDFRGAVDCLNPMDA
jgi:predicted nucleic acid-binding protein